MFLIISSVTSVKFLKSTLPVQDVASCIKSHLLNMSHTKLTSDLRSVAAHLRDIIKRRSRDEDEPPVSFNVLNEEANLKSRALAFQWHFSSFAGIKTLLYPQQKTYTLTHIRFVHHTLISSFQCRIEITFIYFYNFCVINKPYIYIFLHLLSFHTYNHTLSKLKFLF